MHVDFGLRQVEGLANEYRHDMPGGQSRYYRRAKVRKSWPNFSFL
jgi:hypothetical protein